MSAPATEAEMIPVSEASPVLAYQPIILRAPNRTVDLEIKVVTPQTGDALPIILFSHGHGSLRFLSSIEGYGPLTTFWAAHGFVVIQPTHLDSGKLDLRETEDPDAPRTYLRHALPNALTATLTLSGLLLSTMVAGTVLVENVFSWPGLGSEISSSILTKDYPVVQAIVLVYGLGVLAINLLVDIALALLDPRSTILEI